MTGDLSLLPSQAKFRAKRMRIKAKINNFLWVFSGVWMGLIILVVGVFLILKLVAIQTNKNYQRTLNQYKTLLNSMSINQEVRYQAKVVGKVLANRFKYGETIEMVNNLFGKEINVVNLEIKDQKNFVVAGEVINGKDMNTVEDMVKEINDGYVDDFVSARLTSVRFDLKTGWSFIMEVTSI